MEDVGPDDKKKPVASDDALKLRPNPDMLINKDAPEVSYFISCYKKEMKVVVRLYLSEEVYYFDTGW